VSNSCGAQLKIALQNLKMDTGEKVVKYIARTRAIASMLGAAAKPVDEVDLAINVLNELPLEYKVVKTFLLSGNDEQQLSLIQSKLPEHEQMLNREVEQEKVERDSSMAF
jgi:hypothetical protein